MTSVLERLVKELESLKNPVRAQISQRYFKTGPGEYGEGDIFLGLDTPTLVKVIQKYWQDLDFADFEKLLQSPIHEHRTTAVSSLRRQFAKFPQKRKAIYDFYLSHTPRINNWDLVDISAPDIVGWYLFDKPRQKLYDLAKSLLLWDRRVAIMTTFAFIRNNDFDDTLKIARILLTDKHDLIHKAVGWMLREVGKRDPKTLLKFLDEFTPKMPRTTLRYAIEKLPESKRKYYLAL